MKMPKRKVDFEAALALVEEQAFQEGKRSAVREYHASHRPEDVRLKALQEATKFLSLAGQTLASFADCMKSERNQL